MSTQVRQRRAKRGFTTPEAGRKAEPSAGTISNLPARRRGFTLIETLIAFGILSMFVGGGILVAVLGLRASGTARQRIEAAALAQNVVEQLRVIRDWQMETGQKYFPDNISGCGTIPRDRTHPSGLLPDEYDLCVLMKNLEVGNTTSPTKREARLAYLGIQRSFTNASTPQGGCKLHADIEATFVGCYIVSLTFRDIFGNPQRLVLATPLTYWKFEPTQ